MEGRFDHVVPGDARGILKGLDQRHAGADECAEDANRAGYRDLPNEDAEERCPQLQPVGLRPTSLRPRPGSKSQEDRQDGERDRPPESDEEVRDGDERLGDARQVQAGAAVDLGEYGYDEEEYEGDDQHREAYDEDRIDEG